MSLSGFQHLFYCNFNNFWKSILRKKSQPSAFHPFPSFLYTSLKEMWMVKCNVCGYLWKLHVLSFFPQKQATFSAALTWLSSTAKGILQICPSGGFRPMFLFVLRFLVLFFVVAFIFYTNQIFFNYYLSLGQLLIISWYFCYIYDTTTIRAVSARNL